MAPWGAWSGLRRWVTAGVALVIVAITLLIGAAALLDTQHFRAAVIRFVAARLQRPIQVDGALELHLLSLTPGLIAERVTIGNPSWMPPGNTASAERLFLSYELLPLLRGTAVIHRLEATGAVLRLMRDDQGRANWQAHDPGSSPGGGGPPLTHGLWLPVARIDYDDQRRHLHFVGTISAADAAAAAPAPLHINGQGELNGRAATFVIDGDPLATTVRGRPYHFTFSESSSGSRLTGVGSVPRPFDFRALDASFESSGEDLKDLYYLTGVTLVDTGRYRLSGSLSRRGRHFEYDLRATSGDSDMSGTLLIETSQHQPHIDAQLRSQLLRVQDLGPRAAGRGPTAEEKTLLISDTPLRLAAVRRDEAVVDFHAQRLSAGPLDMQGFAMRLTLGGGVLSAAPTASVADGKLSARLRFDATRATPTATLDVSATDLQLGQFHRSSAQAPLEGLIKAHLRMTGQGDSLHQLAATADGTITAVLPHGTVRSSIAELSALDLSHEAGLGLREGAQESGVRCGVASFQLRDGTVSAESVLLDTDAVLIGATGQMHLDTEALDFTVRGRPKRPRLVRVRAPLMVRGTLSHPSVSVEKGKALAQAGVAIALGVALTPLASILAFVDPGLAHDSDCAALLADPSVRDSSRLH